MVVIEVVNVAVDFGEVLLKLVVYIVMAVNLLSLPPYLSKLVSQVPLNQ